MITVYYCEFPDPALSGPLLEASLRDYLGDASASFLFARKEGGKPYLLNDPTVFFSLSHTDGLWVCAVSDDEVGIDAEKIRPLKNAAKIARRFLPKDAGDLVEKNGIGEFFRQWTAFESRAKQSGDGLSKIGGKSPKKGLKIRFVDIKAGYACALCAKGEIQYALKRLTLT